MELGKGSRERGSSRIPPSFRLLFQHKAYLSHAWSLVLMFFITTCHHSSHRRFAFIFFRNTHEKIDKNSLVRSLSRAVPTYLYHTTTTSTSAISSHCHGFLVVTPLASFAFMSESAAGELKKHSGSFAVERSLDPGASYVLQHIPPRTPLTEYLPKQYHTAAPN